MIEGIFVNAQLLSCHAILIWGLQNVHLFLCRNSKIVNANMTK